MNELNLYDESKNEDEVKIIMERLAQSPYGLNVIAAGVNAHLRKLCNVKPGAQVYARYMTGDKGEPALFFWMDATKFVDGSVCQDEVFISSSKKLYNDVKKYIPAMQAIISITKDGSDYKEELK